MQRNESPTYLEQVRAHRERERRIARAAEGVRQVEYEAPKHGKGWRPSRDPKPEPLKRDWLFIATPKHNGAQFDWQADAPRLKRPVHLVRDIVGGWYKISKNDLVSSRRTRHIVRPRQVAMYLARELTQASLPEIGRRFGNRDHTTVLHAVRKIEQLLAENPAFAEDVAALRAQIEQRMPG